MCVIRNRDVAQLSLLAVIGVTRGVSFLMFWFLVFQKLCQKRKEGEKEKQFQFDCVLMMRTYDFQLCEKDHNDLTWASFGFWFDKMQIQLD